MAIAGLLLLSGCATVSAPIAGSGFTFVLQRDQYQILGPVDYEGTSTVVLSVFGGGGATYSELLDLARRTLGADDVVNVTMDESSYSFWFIYTTKTYKIHGLAIKYKFPIREIAGVVPSQSPGGLTSLTDDSTTATAPAQLPVTVPEPSPVPQAPVTQAPNPQSDAPLATPDPPLTLKFPNLPQGLVVYANHQPLNSGLLTGAGIPVKAGQYDFDVKAPSGQEWMASQVTIDQYHSSFRIDSFSAVVPFRTFRNVGDRSEWADLLPVFTNPSQQASAPKGTNILSASMAQDQTYLYVRFELDGKPGTVDKSNFEFKLGNGKVANFIVAVSGGSIADGFWSPNGGTQKGSVKHALTDSGIVLIVPLAKLKELAKGASFDIALPQTFLVDVYNPDVVKNNYVSSATRRNIILERLSAN